MGKIIPETGDHVKPDGWEVGSNLLPSDGYSDSLFPGCDFRLPSIGGNLAVNIKVTGHRTYITDLGRVKVRCRIEFVGDGSPSTFAHGWLIK